MPKASTSVTRESTRLREQRKRVPTKKKSRKRARPEPPPDSPPDSPSPPERYSQVTNPAKVDRPVQKYVHPALALAWTINRKNPMWYIFDGHTPARHFKRDMPYDANKNFPAYGPPPWDDLTENDLSGSDALMPYAPPSYKCVSCTLFSSSRLILMGF